MSCLLVVCCFWVGFYLFFVLYFGVLLSDMFWKNSLDVGSSDLGSLSLSLSLRFCSDVVVVTGHTPHRAFLALFLFFVPATLVLSPVLPVFFFFFWRLCFWSIFSVVFVFPFCCVCGCFTQTRRVEPSSYEPYPRSSYLPRARVRAQGSRRAQLEMSRWQLMVMWRTLKCTLLCNQPHLSVCKFAFLIAASNHSVQCPYIHPIRSMC